MRQSPQNRRKRLRGKKPCRTPRADRTSDSTRLASSHLYSVGYTPLQSSWTSAFGGGIPDLRGEGASYAAHAVELRSGPVVGQCCDPFRGRKAEYQRLPMSQRMGVDLERKSAAHSLPRAGESHGEGNMDASATIAPALPQTGSRGPATTAKTFPS
jgi:hypothetical protein